MRPKSIRGNDKQAQSVVNFCIELWTSFSLSIASRWRIADNENLIKRLLNRAKIMRKQQKRKTITQTKIRHRCVAATRLQVLIAWLRLCLTFLRLLLLFWLFFSSSVVVAVVVSSTRTKWQAQIAPTPLRSGTLCSTKNFSANKYWCRKMNIKSQIRRWHKHRTGVGWLSSVNTSNVKWRWKRWTKDAYRRDTNWPQMKMSVMACLVARALYRHRRADATNRIAAILFFINSISSYSSSFVSFTPFLGRNQ